MADHAIDLAREVKQFLKTDRQRLSAGDRFFLAAHVGVNDEASLTQFPSEILPKRIAQKSQRMRSRRQDYRARAIDRITFFQSILSCLIDVADGRVLKRRFER